MDRWIGIGDNRDPLEAGRSLGVGGNQPGRWHPVLNLERCQWNDKNETVLGEFVGPTGWMLG